MARNRLAALLPFLGGACLIFTAAPLWAQAAVEEKRDRTAGDILLQGAAGAAGSLLLAVPTYLYLDGHAGDGRIEGDTFYSPTANVGLIASSAIGSAVGVYVAGELLRLDGSFWSAALGSGIASLPFLLGTHDPYLPYYALTLGVALQDVGSLVGF